MNDVRDMGEEVKVEPIIEETITKNTVQEVIAELRAKREELKSLLLEFKRDGTFNGEEVSHKLDYEVALKSKLEELNESIKCFIEVEIDEIIQERLEEALKE